MTETQRTEQFLTLYASCETHLLAYLITLLGNRSDAEEVFQETTLALWRSFDEFQPGTSFVNWARRVAFHRVLSFRRRQQRHDALHDDEFLNAVEQEVSNQSELLQVRLRALETCISKLTKADRKLLELRYSSNCKVKDLAERAGEPVKSLYRVLERIRHALVECVERALAREQKL